MYPIFKQNNRVIIWQWLLSLFVLASPLYAQEKIQIIGDSLTHGSISANYVYLLQKEFNHRIEFSKKGVNGDLSYNLLKRVPGLANKKPNKVVVLIGSNDVLAQFSHYFYRNHKLPQKPSLGWFKKNLKKIINIYQKKKIFDMALVSIPPMGENLKSKHNRMIYKFNHQIKKMAEHYQLTYIPFGEKLFEELKIGNIVSHRKCETIEIALLSMKTRYEREVLNWSWNKISDRNRFLFNTDCIHINDRAAKILAELIKNIYLI